MSDKHKLKLDPTVESFMKLHGQECAAHTLTGGQHLRYQMLLLALLAMFCYDWKIFAAALLFACSGFYVMVTGYKLLTVLLSLVYHPEIKIRHDEILSAEIDWPVYTILVPMYKEKEEALKVVHMIESLDYPKDKLDVKLLLEEDDDETVRILRNAELPPYIELMVVPHAMPKTKPKACNHGLLAAKGKYLVIFDAEDRPDCDQLKKAALAFQKMPENVVCLQAKLNYYNPDQNVLTRWFTLEYTAWYDLFLPGLNVMQMPIPLGGTSNHFRIEALSAIGGWDPFNLTEDCDLGVRLYRKGWRTLVLDSVTWEEANSQLGNWIRQRSRWVKGYIQSHFVHARSNLKTIRELGPKGYFSFMMTVGGLSATLLLNPIFWVTGAIYLGLGVTHAAGITDLGPWQLRYYDRVADVPGSPLTVWSELSIAFWVAAVGLVAANAVFILINLLACARRGLWNLALYALLSPLYWALISIAAWKGFLQLFSKPFYWEKTVHGLTDADNGACHLPAPDDFAEGGADA